jgi:uncharacterized protein
MIKRGKEVISKNELVCKSIISQARGLMFRKKKENLIMIFPEERKISLHMFFVFYPIDVVLLNKEKEVIDIKNDFRPFTFWNSLKKGKYLIELAKKHPEIKIGDKLKFKK